MQLFKKLKGVHYVRIQNGYVIDCLPYNPHRDNYIAYKGEVPADVMCGCYIYKKNKLIADNTKYQIYLASLPKEVSDNE